jgi:rSAM-associated Gly-rich repeat protein
MSSKGSVARALKLILSGGALSASLVLALSASEAAAAATPSASPQTAPADSVSERLRAIRTGVSELAQSQNGAGSAEPEATPAAQAAPTWWGNGGWGRWHMGWGNGGWGWPNWHNWGNGWHNWGNGWHNFWHNW